MVLAKLLVGCPLEPEHRCPKCLLSMNREAKKLMRSAWPIVALQDHMAERYRRRIRREQEHRAFIQLLDSAPGHSNRWYADRLKVRVWKIREWMRRERAIDAALEKARRKAKYGLL